MISIKATQKAKDYHFNAVYGEINRRLSDILKKKKIIRGTKKKKKIINLRPELENYLDRLNTGGNLKNLIQGSPDSLESEIENFNKEFKTDVSVEKTKISHEDYTILTSIFFDFGYNSKSFDKGTFIELLDIDTCPYCNRSYIYRLNKSKKVKPEIDHFYPKSIYPFLAASFYNLIPSCQTCNGLSVKGSIDTYTDKVMNPYLIGHEDFKFTYDIVSMSLFNPISTKGSIKVKVKLTERIAQNDKLFKLTEFYEKHEDHVLELIIKSQLEYSKKYRDYLSSYNGLHFSDSEIDRLIVGNYTGLDELHKRPLSKLYRDIAIELGLIKY